MTNILKTAAVAALVGLGTLAGTAAASADGLYFSFGQGKDPRFGIHLGNGPRNDRFDDRRDGRRDGRWFQPPRHVQLRCTPAKALGKAAQIGINRAQVVDVDPGRIKVAGRRFGDRVVVTFGSAPNCPVIRW